MGFGRTYVVLSVLIGITSCLLANQFLAPKKNNPSASKIKEHCYEQCAVIIEQIPQAMHALADLHHEAFTTLQNYCMGQKNSYDNLSKEQLIENKKTIDALVSLCEDFIMEINQKLKEIKSTKK